MKVNTITLDTRQADAPARVAGLPPDDGMTGQEFAASRRQALMALGFTLDQAWKISNAAGPGRAVEATEWVLEMVEDETDWYLLQMLISGAFVPGNRTGWVHKTEVFARAGFELPLDDLGSNIGFTKFLRGVRAALFTDRVRFGRMVEMAVN